MTANGKDHLMRRLSPDPPVRSRLLRIARALLCAVFVAVFVPVGYGATATEPEASISIDAAKPAGVVPRYLFGQMMEHEHNTIDNGLLAQLLQDRKFDEGDLNGEGVANGWVPEERIEDRYWQLKGGQGVGDRYYIDHQHYYGRLGASQAIQLQGPAAGSASVYQIRLQLAKGRRYQFYVYLRKEGSGTAFAEVEQPHGEVYVHKDFTSVNAHWVKYSFDFTAPEDTTNAAVRIGFRGRGTLWMDSASLMPADNIDGMRRDVIQALRRMKISILRYPGGCYADFYHWKDGIGPRDQRPETWSTPWKEWNSNDFGTDEYIELAQLLGFEGHITANYISGTPKEAAEWVQYTNGARDTPMGRLRTRNGHPKPLDIKFWAIGNEAPSSCSRVYTGGTSVSDYVRRFHEYKSAMQKADPSIRIMASSVGHPEWAKKLLQAMPVDMLATSIYTGPHPRVKQICRPSYYYRKVVAEPLEFKEKLEANIRAADGLLPNHPFFAITEFNSWWMPESGDPDYRLANALYFAGVFNTILRHSRYVFLAETCSLINVQGMIEVNPVAIKLTPPYFAYVLYANHIGKTILATETNVAPVAFNPRLPALDAVATLAGGGGTVYLAVVNRSEDRAISATVHLSHWLPSGSQAQVYELDGKNWNASNPYGSTANVNIQHHTVNASQPAFAYLFPAHSVTVLELSGSKSGGVMRSSGHPEP